MRSRESQDEKVSSDGLLGARKKIRSEDAPHRTALVAATRHIVLSPISRCSSSSFVPSAYNFMNMVSSICSLLVNNPQVHNTCSALFSPAIYLYYSYVYYYHILRARAAAGEETRMERGALRCLERVGPPEAWPVAAPLIGFIEFLGAHHTANPYYGWIVPAFPDFSKLGSDKCLTQLLNMPGSSRIPLVPAYQKFGHNFGPDKASFDDAGLLHPTLQPLNDSNSFCGLVDSTADSLSFQALAFNLAWLEPHEHGCSLHNANKAGQIRRREVPDVPSNASLDTLPKFLGFLDNEGCSWMIQLLRMAEAVNKFFPGSTNLGSISPLTSLPMATLVAYKSDSPLVVEDHVWYHSRPNMTYNAKGFTRDEQGIAETKMSTAVSPNATYPVLLPDEVDRSDPVRLGPFFNDDSNCEQNFEFRCAPVIEAYNVTDPAHHFASQVLCMFRYE